MHHWLAALRRAVRHVSLLRSATIEMATPEGRVLIMLGSLWTVLPPVLPGLRPWWPHKLGQVLAVAVLGLVLVGRGTPLQSQNQRKWVLQYPITSPPRPTA